MHSKDNNRGAKSQDQNFTSASERIETIEELLRARGFFDSHLPESKESK